MDFKNDPGLLLYLPLYELYGASLMSRDAYGHLCTVTGALWRPHGRYFDGTDDKINCGSASVLNNIFDGGGTTIAWINPSSDGESDKGRVWDKGSSLFVSGESTGKVKVSFAQVFDGTGGEWATTATEVTINTFACVTVTYNADSVNNNPIFYVHGVLVTSTEVSTPVGTRTSDGGNSLLIGNNSVGSRSFANLIGEVWFYNRVLTPQEVQNIYLATKWRYR